MLRLNASRHDNYAAADDDSKIMLRRYFHILDASFASNLRVGGIDKIMTYGRLIVRSASRHVTPLYNALQMTPCYVYVSEKKFLTLGLLVVKAWAFNIFGISNIRDITFRRDDCDI